MTHSLIIGGTRGLGRVVANTLAARGDSVSIIGRSAVPQDELADATMGCYPADLDDLPSLQGVLDQALEERGAPSYCVFAQRYRGKGDPWQGEMETSLTATKTIIDHLAPHFSQGQDAGIVLVSSVFARAVGEGQGLGYHVAKAGQEQMVRWFAVNLGSRGIRVNGVAPFTFLKPESRDFYLANQPLMGLYRDIVPLGRLGTTEDSANLIAFLCSPLASYITGQNIAVDGGLSLQWPESLARRLTGI
jgi:NAD(P)-dependent dehydrogenase (short-subunit alcohol dehydrogenase family)